MIFKDKPVTNFTPGSCKIRWSERLKKNKRKYFFEHHNSGLKTKQIFILAVKDIQYFIDLNIYILKNVYVFGALIKKIYSLPRIHQWFRMFYITFILKVNPINFRSRQLFKTENWELADLFDYDSYKPQLYLAKKTEPGEHEIISDKFLFYKFCLSHKINTPGVLGIIENGEILYPPDKSIDLPASDLFIKERKGGKGRNAKKFLYSNRYYYSDGSQYHSSKLLSHLQSISSGGIMIQLALQNHPSWKGFTSGALATCRVVTGRQPHSNKILPLHAVLRMPVKNNITDNYFSGGLISNIHLETGELGTAYCLNPVYDSFEFNTHPDTGFIIKNTVVPKWKELLGFTISVHSSFKTIFVGWDISLTTEGITVVEGNIEWSASAYEITNQKPFNRTIFPELYEAWIDKIS